MLTAENYTKGFLVDEDLMAGVSQHPQQPGNYVAFVLRHSTGEYLGYQNFTDLGAALAVVNQIPRTWSFEKLGGCGNGNCGNGQCAAGGCGQKGSCAEGACGPA